MATLPPNPLNLGGASLPSELVPKGKLALPDNPIGAAFTNGPKVTAPVVNKAAAHGAVPALASATERASRAGNAAYNKVSGGTQGVVAGMNPRDLKAIRVAAKNHPAQAELAGSLVNPIEWGVQAVQGVKQIGQGAEKVVHGNLGGGAAEAGLGALGVAGVLPIGRSGKIAEAIGLSLKAGRTDSEAIAHALEASNAAKAQGFGKTAANVLVPPETQTAGKALSETERAAQVRGALEGAPVTREAQKLLQSAERGKRFAASAAEAQKHEGVAAYHAAVGQLRGKLPQLNYKGFSELDGQTLNALLEDVKNHPTLKQGQKITAQRSLMKAIGEGKVPTAGEEKILRTVFGDAVTEQIKSSAGFFKTYKNLALDAANIPRAIMSSADLSAPLRQGLVGMVTHPVISLRAFPSMIKMFGSENLYQASRSAIENDPLFPLAMKADLPLTGIGTKDAAASLVGREEAYQSNLAERLNLREIKFLRGLGKLGTGPGDLIRMSDRAYTGYLNEVRMGIFKDLVHDAATQGRDVNDPKLLKDIARFVGSATGRGPLGPLKNHAVSINALFFSPKLLASRLDILLSPVTYLNADPFVRRQALEATFKLVGTMSLVLYLAKLGGASVNLDPTNADFGKIRIGNTRIDIAGGFQQPVRLAFELAEGKVTSSTTGKSMALSGGIGKTSSGDVALRFLMSKAAPVPGFALQASGVSQATFGPHQSAWSLAMQKLLPLLAQDANDLRTTPGAFGGSPSIGKAIAGYGLGVFGVGEQTYAAKTPKASSGGSSDGFGDTGNSFGDGGSFGSDGGSFGG